MSASVPTWAATKAASAGLVLTLLGLAAEHAVPQVVGEVDLGLGRLLAGGRELRGHGGGNCEDELAVFDALGGFEGHEAVDIADRHEHEFRQVLFFFCIVALFRIIGDEKRRELAPHDTGSVDDGHALAQFKLFFFGSVFVGVTIRAHRRPTRLGVLNPWLQEGSRLARRMQVEEALMHLRAAVAADAPVVVDAPDDMRVRLYVPLDLLHLDADELHDRLHHWQVSRLRAVLPDAQAGVDFDQARPADMTERGELDLQERWIGLRPYVELDLTPATNQDDIKKLASLVPEFMARVEADGRPSGFRDWEAGAAE